MRVGGGRAAMAGRVEIAPYTTKSRHIYWRDLRLKRRDFFANGAISCSNWRYICNRAN
jgi:hypothetical protein